MLQHLQDILDLRVSALDWMLKAYPEVKEREDMRRIVGRYGLTGSQQVLNRDGPNCSLHILEMG